MLMQMQKITDDPLMQIYFRLLCMLHVRPKDNELRLEFSTLIGLGAEKPHEANYVGKYEHTIATTT